MFFSGCTDKYRDLGIILDVSGSMCYDLCVLVDFLSDPPQILKEPWGCCKPPGIGGNEVVTRACDDCDGELCGKCNRFYIDEYRYREQCANAYRNPGIGKGKEVIKKIANIANFTTNGSHGAFMLFNNTPTEPIITFDDIASVDQFNKKVDEVNEDCFGGTNITRALNHSLSKLFDYPNGMRDNTEKVALLITDGSDRNDNDTYDEMGQKFKEQDITLIVIAVGNIDEGKLRRLVQSPSYVFPANDWDDLDDALIKFITAAICDGNTCLL